MQKAKVWHNGQAVSITAPQDKTMVFDPAMLQHGVLSIGEYGPSGRKIAAFAIWDYAIFDGEDHGYIITNE